MTHNTNKTTHFTMPAILPAILTGLFILTACGGGALPNDGQVAPDTQNNACKTNPLAEGCQQAGAGFLSVNANANQEVAVSVAPVVKKLPADTPAPVSLDAPVVKKTEPVLEELAKKQTPPAPAPITQADTYDFAPESAYSTYSSPSSDGPRGQSSHTVTAATTAAFTAFDTMRASTIDDKGTAETSDDTTDQRNQFLQSGASELDRTTAGRADPLRMNLAQAYHDGAAIGGDVGDGIDFFTRHVAFVPKDSGGAPIGDITITRYHYAGILSGTDLGAPVATSGVTAIWYGSFRTYNTNPVDFELTVGFGGDETSRTISAFVKDNAWSAVDNYYLLEGKYTTAGVITGTVNWGQFTGGDKNTPVGTNNGILRGLIGAEGAVGVFISGSEVVADGKVTGGTGPNTAQGWGSLGYAGGFVASASLPEERVTYSDWATSIGNPSLRAEEDDANSDLFSQFLAIREGATELDETGAGAVTEKGGLTLADDVDSGVSFFGNGISLATLTFGSQSYAGLLAGTDLGAPINNADQVGEWKGQFKSVGGYYYGAISSDTRVETAIDDTDFTLTVTFSGGTGTVEAYVPIDQAGRHFYITGTYDDKGVISGYVNAANFNNIGKPTTPLSSSDGNGILTGLIGVEGAVGAFVSNADNYNYAGGFVATEPESEPTLPNYSSFVEHYGSRLNADLTTGGGSAFLEGTETGLNMTGLVSSASINAIKLGGDADSVDGFSIIRVGTATTNPALRAGLLSGTDLGAVLDNPASMTWNGSIHLLGSSFGGSSKDDLILTVDFAAGTIVATAVSIGGSFQTSGTVAINGQFGSKHGLSDGILGGNVVRNSGTPLPLIGLIGEEGVIGVFHSNSFVGGFQAMPAPPAPASVNFTAWEDSFTGGVNALQTLRDSGVNASGFANNSSHYIKLGGSNNIAVTGLSGFTFPNNLFLTDRSRANNTSGVIFAVNSATKQSFVGLLPTTDVGTAITSQTRPTATWTGSLKISANGGATNISFNSFSLRVNFANRKITTFSSSGNPDSFGVASVGNNSRFSVEGNFNADGVMSGEVGLVVGFGVPAVNGVFSGLIGENGAVGALKGTVSTGGYAGGFVVNPSN